MAKRFGKMLGIDPGSSTRCSAIAARWISPGPGLDGLQRHVDGLLAKVRRKYREYGINEALCRQGRQRHHGMGIMTVHDAKELDDLNRRATRWPSSRTARR